MARMNSLLMAERLIHGGTAKYLRKLRAEGHSWDLIARRIEADHGITVTAETVRSWARQLDIPTSTRTGTAA